MTDAATTVSMGGHRDGARAQEEQRIRAQGAWMARQLAEGERLRQRDNEVRAERARREAETFQARREGQGPPEEQAESDDGRSRAHRLLENLLPLLPLPAKQIESLLDAAGVRSRDSITGAKRDLGIVSVQRGGGWVWEREGS